MYRVRNIPAGLKLVSAFLWRLRRESILFFAFCPSLDSFRFLPRPRCSWGMMENTPTAM